MTLRSIRCGLAALALALTAPFATPAAAADLLVRLHTPDAHTALAVATGRPGLAPVATAVGPAWFRLSSAQAVSREDLSRLAAELRRDRRIALVLEPRHESLTRVPNDTLFSSDQWWLGERTAGSTGVPGLPPAWDRSIGQPASGLPPVIAVLDSGYTSHPELDSRWVGAGHDFVSSVDYANDGNGRDNDARDPGDRLTEAEIKANLALWDGCEARAASSWHGTLMAGQVGAVSNNAKGVAGIHWDARLLPVRVAGKCGAAVGDVVDGLRWAAGLPVAGAPANTTPAKVIVVGVAGFSSCNPADSDPNVAAAAQLYIDTLAEVRNAGAIVIAAAGNQRGAVGRPASCPGAFAVTSLNRQGFKAIYANYGPQVALATVGGDAANGRDCDTQLADTGIASTFNLGTGAAGEFGYAAASGTSFASPVVGGVAALMWSLNPALTVAQVEAGLRASALPHVKVPLLRACDAASGNKGGRCQCDSAICGAGILDADEALAYAADPAAYTAPARTATTLDTPQIRACAVSLGLPVPGDPPPDNGGGGGGGGGGALGLTWLLAMLAAIALLQHAGRGPRRRR